MKDLQNLLSQVSIITKKNAEFLDATGGRFNIFRITGVNHYENKHSLILAELLNPKGTHGLKEKFLKAFCDRIVLDNDIRDLDCEKAIVITEAHTEDGRIDILIKDNKGHAIIIENKIYASDQNEQLKRYHTHAESRYDEKFQIFYLTLDGKMASDNSGGGIKYTTISYAKDIIGWLEECINLAARFPLVRETISQYINHIKQLTNQDIAMNNKSELIELLSKPENLEAAFTIAENITSIKLDLVKKMAERIAQDCRVKYEVSQDGFGIGFYKEEWEKNAGIWFAEDKGNTYYAIKNADARNGKAVLQNHITELFHLKPIPHDPFGYGYVCEEHWKNNKQLYAQIADGTFGQKYILPSLRNVLEYLSKHPEIEGKLKKG